MNEHLTAASESPPEQSAERGPYVLARLPRTVFERYRSRLSSIRSHSFSNLSRTRGSGRVAYPSFPIP